VLETREKKSLLKKREKTNIYLFRSERFIYYDILLYSSVNYCKWRAMRIQEEGRTRASIILLLLVLSIPLSYGIIVFSYNFELGHTQPRPSDVSGVTVVYATPEGVIGEDVKTQQGNRLDEEQTLTKLWAVLSALPLAAMLCTAASAPVGVDPNPSISEKWSGHRAKQPKRRDRTSREYRSRANTTFISNESEESGCSGCSERPDKPAFKLFFVGLLLLLLVGSASAITYQYNQSGQPSKAEGC